MTKFDIFDVENIGDGDNILVSTVQPLQTFSSLKMNERTSQS